MFMSRNAWFSTRSSVGGTGSAFSSGFLLSTHAPRSARQAANAVMSASGTRRDCAGTALRLPRSIRMVSPSVPARAGRKKYDEAYFTKWYRDPRTRVHSPDAVRRKIRMVVGVAEHFLGRK